MIRKAICFDMDGTLADLYGYPDWLGLLHKESVTPYYNAKPLVDMPLLRGLLFQLIKNGYEIHIVSWLCKNSSDNYKKRVIQSKKSWLSRYHFPYDTAHFLQYGSSKSSALRKYFREYDNVILVDDDQRIRRSWTMGGVIDPTKEKMIDRLMELIEQ